MGKQYELKEFKLEIKSIDENGVFEGYASIFGNIDLVNDIMEKGAFKRTLNSQQGKIIILDQHDKKVEVGITTECKEDNKGLWFKGQLYIDNNDPKNEIPEARNVYVKMKRRQEYGKPLGISIGYTVIQYKYETIARKMIRRLKEVKLFEISLVTWAANPKASVVSVKEVNKLDAKAKTFSQVLGEKDVRKKYYDISDALWSAIHNVLSNEGKDDDDTRKAALATTCDEFKAVLVTWFDTYLGVEQSKSDESQNEIKAFMEDIEEKAGKKISKANMVHIKNAISALQTLLGVIGAIDDSGESHSKDGKGSPGPVEGKENIDEIDLSKLNSIMEEMKSYHEE